MKSSNQRVTTAKATAKANGLDTILDVYEDRNFVEIIGKMGGDTITYRIYDNGTITER